MEQEIRKQNPLETEPVGKLLRRYSVPTAMTLMVNYLYNIVDQIFVGQGVGISGMAATRKSRTRSPSSGPKVASEKSSWTVQAIWSFHL